MREFTSRNNQFMPWSDGRDLQQLQIWFPPPRRCFPFADANRMMLHRYG
ncbi:hypothetical protein RB36 [Rhodopirellula baltica SH 1]|uniref:Uncharacterized protein n=1 Tax=Rhodopirellula baltica (strain DSM 10527 / NCIMB 13988 / SH1) TaxID=243090 RepID=Q7UZD4_RHOBA|nr:hypothetical protein RB36 [Rhodopirellula baltica SH 1]